jgi:hypothetical protein
MASRKILLAVGLFVVSASVAAVGIDKAVKGWDVLQSRNGDALPVWNAVVQGDATMIRSRP